MRTKHLFPIVLTALALGACSDNSIPGNEQNGASWDSEGKGYVTLALNLPTEKASRANDNFDDGLESEYRVHNATLILFAGADEASSTFHSAYKLNLNGWNQEGTTTDQITTYTKIVQKINQVDADQVYALVVLNDNGFLTVSGEEGKLTINGQEVMNTTTWTNFSTILTGLTNESFTKTGLLMANAPLATAPGGSTQPTGTVFTLADVDEKKIFDNYAQASTNPAATIYVERAVAKVTVNKKSDLVDGGTTTGGGNKTYTIEGWCLDQTNTQSYLVRKVASNPTWLAYKSGGSSDYRFVGGSSIGGYYRTYWGEDPNYTSTVAGQLSKINTSAEFETNFGTNHPAYCLENTFNVDTQDKDKTTRVIVKAKFNGGTSFYLRNRNEAEWYDATGMENLFKAAFLTEPTIKDWLNKNLASGQQVTNDNLVLTFNSLTPTDGIVVLKDIVIEGLTWNSESQPALPEDAIALTNASVGTVNYYADGMAYYSVLIQHFGDEQTPWNTWETDPKPSATSIYPGANAEQNYLGRYGVLRNNWYDLTINSIKNIGDPVVPSVDGKDDDLDAYISVTINVLSWAKRTQGVDL